MIAEALLISLFSVSPTPSQADFGKRQGDDVIISYIKSESSGKEGYLIDNHWSKPNDNVDFILALAPVIVNVVLMVAFELNASVAMAIVVFAMFPVLMIFNRYVNLKEVFVGALDYKMFANIICILLFIQLLDCTGLLAQIVSSFESSVLPVPVIIGCIAFIVGVLTGISQGHIAIVMPIVAALSMGDLDLVGVAMVFGVAGQMITPTHVCLTITVDYFKSDFFKTLKPVVIAEIGLLLAFVAVSYLTWGQQFF